VLTAEEIGRMAEEALAEDNSLDLEAIEEMGRMAEEALAEEALNRETDHKIDQLKNQLDGMYQGLCPNDPVIN